jgi:chemotaxis protein MotB
MARGDRETRPIIIKRVKKVAGGHHGGAWKVAYADFVTAMMAFFMLLWLLSVSDEVTLQGLADYFTPSNATMSNNSGSGQILGGTALEKEGAKSSGAVALTLPSSSPQQNEDADQRAVANQEQQSTSNWDSKLPPTPDAQLAKVEDDLKTAIQATPELSKYKDQIMLEQTPDGLRIQLIDRDQRPMFQPASATLYPFAERLFRGLAGIIQGLPNRITVFGHTDSAPGANDGAYTNWELSADRANAARRVLVGGGVTRDRVSEVVGKADTDALYPDAPERPENRRISILLLREAPVLAPDMGR